MFSIHRLATFGVVTSKHPSPLPARSAAFPSIVLFFFFFFLTHSSIVCDSIDEYQNQKKKRIVVSNEGKEKTEVERRIQTINVIVNIIVNI